MSTPGRAGHEGALAAVAPLRSPEILRYKWLRGQRHDEGASQED
jgi:hypothetical protein